MKDFIYDCKCQNNDKNQIEEMYQEFLQHKHDTMCEVFSYKGMCENFINLGYRKINDNEVVISKEEKQKLLKEMYEQGKFDVLADLEKEGKVVISKEEYEKKEKQIKDLKYALKVHSERLDHFYNLNEDVYYYEEKQAEAVKQARKETAEKIYNKGKELFKELFGEDFDKTGLGEYIVANFLTEAKIGE